MSKQSKVKISINRVREIVKRHRESHDKYDDDFDFGRVTGANDAIANILLAIDREEAAKATLARRELKKQERRLVLLEQNSGEEHF